MRRIPEWVWTVLMVAAIAAGTAVLVLRTIAGSEELANSRAEAESVR